jgi:hypothetical protein
LFRNLTSMMLSEEKKGKSLLLYEKMTINVVFQCQKIKYFCLLGDDTDPRASAIDELRQLGEIRLKQSF